MRNILLAMLLTLTPSLVQASEEADHSTHEELRNLLHGIEQAINSEKYDDLAPYFHNKAIITTINQEVLSSPAEIHPYFTKWFGPGGYLKKLEMSLSPDVLTEFYADKNLGVVRGSGNESYVLSDGRFFPMKTRWTATVIKDTDGKWRILALHIGTNFLDNPILSKAEESLIYAAGGGMAGGVILGGIVTLLFKRRAKMSA